jgi:hypothetical protein
MANADNNHPWRKLLCRLGIWLLVGALSASAVCLSELGVLISGVESAGQRSYGPAVFTGMHTPPDDTADLAGAIRLWHDVQNNSTNPFFDVLALLDWHLDLDFWVFAPAYCLLLALMLGRVGNWRFAVLGPLVLLGIDLRETALTGRVLVDGKLGPASAETLAQLQRWSLAKWWVLIALLVTLVVRWYQRRASKVGRHSPARLVLPLIGSVTAFALLVALPAGGPLDQIPDVIRGQLATTADPRHLVASVVALLVFSAVAAHATYGALRVRPAAAQPVKHWVVLAVAAGASVLCGLTAKLYGPGAGGGAGSVVYVVLAVYLAALLAYFAGASSEGPPIEPSGTPDRGLWAGGIAGAIVVVGGLGLLRAAFSPMVLKMSPGVVPWQTAAWAGVITAVVGGFGTQTAVWLLSEWQWPAARWALRIGAWMLAASTTIAAASLMIWSDEAHIVGSLAVVATAFASAALGFGLLARFERQRRPWKPASLLGFSSTPWVTMIVAAWIVASVLNTQGIYHDARVSRPAVGTRTYDNVADAFTKWVSAQSGCFPPPGQTMPMVLVAAPGGGIRAAYWTAATLDRLFGVIGQQSNCAGRRLLAISGVSGGSVGTTIWLASQAAGALGLPNAEKLSSDHALANAVAGLLFRDVPQPLTGGTTWRNRASLLEDGWTHVAPVLQRSHDDPQPISWSDLGKGMGWIPITILNSSSVADGCRVLISNVGELPADGAEECLSQPAAPARGPLTGSIDALAELRVRSEKPETLCANDPKDPVGNHGGVSAVTAALLSARFPLITPSGALLRCVPTPERAASPSQTPSLMLRTTYAVDGGYFENSGLLTTLQLWAALEPLVREHNQSKDAVQIVPYIVIADNHYRSTARGANPRRPLETQVPFRALANDRTWSPAALEQMASVAMGRSWTAGSTSPLGRVVVVAPRKRPAVEAPLGWVLSEMSRLALRDELDEGWPAALAAQPSLAQLIGQLNSPARY